MARQFIYVKAPAKGEIYIGPTLRDRLDIPKDSTIRFGEATFKVAGIIEIGRAHV